MPIVRLYKIGNFIIKSIIIELYRRSATNRGYSSPYSLYCHAFVFAQRLYQPITLAISCFIAGNLILRYSRSVVFLIPGCLYNRCSYTSRIICSYSYILGSFIILLIILYIFILFRRYFIYPSLLIQNIYLLAIYLPIEIGFLTNCVGFFIF